MKHNLKSMSLSLTESWNWYCSLIVGTIALICLYGTEPHHMHL